MAEIVLEGSESDALGKYLRRRRKGCPDGVAWRRWLQIRRGEAETLSVFELRCLARRHPRTLILLGMGFLFAPPVEKVVKPA